MSTKWMLRLCPENFAEVVWQSEDCFTDDELNLVLSHWANMVQDILICLSNNKTTDEILEKLDNDYYPLGDLVNFLENIEICSGGKNE